MVINKILYFILVIISLAFYLLYIDNLSFLILIFVLLLPVFLALILNIFKLSAEVKISVKENTSIKKGKIIFSAAIKNKTIFPFPNSTLVLEYYNTLNRVYEQLSVSVPVHAKSSEKIEIGLSSDYCGILEMRVKSFKVYDYLKLFSCRVKTNSSVQVYIMPDIHEINHELSIKNLEADEGERYSKNKSGDDPSEIFDLKEYIIGDRLNRIHWNQSLRQDKLITRYYSQPVSSDILIAVEYLKCECRCILQLIDSVTEILASLSEFFLKNDISHSILFYNSDTNKIEKFAVSCSEELSEIIIDMYKNGLYSGNPVLWDFIKSNKGDYSKIIYITPNVDTDELEFSNENLSVAIVNENIPDSGNYEINPYVSFINPGNISEGINKIIL